MGIALVQDEICYFSQLKLTVEDWTEDFEN